MDFTTVALAAGLAGLAGVFFGIRLQPKNKTQRELQDYYETALATLKRDVKSLRAKAAYYQKGAIPSDLANASDAAPEALVDGIIAALPANWRSIVSTFRPQIVEEMKRDPQATKQIIEVIKSKVGGNQGAQGEKSELSVDAI